jgi:cbb3-type cytochrome oxidase subunit 3
VSSLVAQLSDQAVLIQHAAGLTGLAVFLVPVVVWWAFWLPARVRFAREAAAASALLGAGVGMDLFALRGLSNLPLRVLVTIGGDPVAAWRNGDAVVIDALARRELDRVGVQAPPTRTALS